MLTPAIFVQFVVILFGACLLIIAFGMWTSRRKYPVPELPADNTEGFVMAALALAGLLLVAMGVML